MNEPRNPAGFLRQHRHLKQQTSDWLEYERRKAAWIAVHPNPTPAYYTAAMKRIRAECGVAG